MPSAGLSCLWNFLGVLFMTQIRCRCVLSHICLFPLSSVEQHLRAGMRRREGVCTLCGRGDCKGWLVVHLLSSSWCVEEERRKLEKKTCSSGSSLQWEVSESLPSGQTWYLVKRQGRIKMVPTLKELTVYWVAFLILPLDCELLEGRHLYSSETVYTIQN